MVSKASAKEKVKLNEVTITDADFDRLRHLVDSPRYHGAQSSATTNLKEELGRGRIVATNSVPKAVVTMRSQVKVRDMKLDETETYTLVYPEEADINDDKLSVLAPLGRALLGSHVGQVIEFDAPGGKRKLKIEKILYQPEAAGDFHL
ncbi:MAG: nucleoside diphosphate kinase regulator [Phycisphaerales bacterium]|jgi:regulator of nucleoside diphosphate kinase|nr:nucleoside diphosphate kinase regulator [Phycisphaerales bacterium]